jgi:hypothetical protein
MALELPACLADLQISARPFNEGEEFSRDPGNLYSTSRIFLQ